jgi:hypothetical protein
MEALVLNRIRELLIVRRWYRTNRWATWTDRRKEQETELRALVRLARQYRKETTDHPVDATWAA